jgi:DNA replication protein DnaC
MPTSDIPSVTTATAASTARATRSARSNEVNRETEALRQQLTLLKMPFAREHFEPLALEAAAQHCSHVGYFARLIEGEAAWREDRSVHRRVRLARFPVIKTLEQFDWNWPKKINRLQVQNLFRLAFLEHNANVIFLGTVGVGKSHLSIALAHTACMRGHSVLFTTAIDIVNTLSAAQATGTLKRAMNRYLRPALVLIDELGYLPIDKAGADLLFQIISGRYEHGSTLITSNRVYKRWAEIFNNDSTLTSALLDRLLHHAETVLIEGPSYRGKDRVEPSE